MNLVTYTDLFILVFCALYSTAIVSFILYEVFCHSDKMEDLKKEIEGLKDNLDSFKGVD